MTSHFTSLIDNTINVFLLMNNFYVQVYMKNFEFDLMYFSFSDVDLNFKFYDCFSIFI